MHSGIYGRPKVGWSEKWQKVWQVVSERERELHGGVIEEGADTVTKTLDFEKQLGLKILEAEETEFTLFLEAELDRPSTWSSTVFNEHPAYSITPTTEIS